MKNQQNTFLIAKCEAPGICPVCLLVNPALLEINATKRIKLR